MACLIQPFLYIAGVLLVGCVSTTRIEGIPPEEARVEIEAPDAETLRFEQPPIITAAAVGDLSMLIAFEAKGQSKFARGTRDNRQNISTHINWFPVYQLLPIDADTFAAETAAADSIGFYQAEVWQAVRQAVFEQLTPPGETGSYARPFVAIDRDTRNFGFLSLEPFTFGDSPNNYAVKGVKLGDHAYIGGMNIGREYRWEWHDMMMRVEGSIVSYIEREFDKSWAHRGVLGDFVLAGKTLNDPMPDSDEVDHPIRPLLTLPRRSEIYKAQVEAIRNSQRYIYLQNAYLSDAGIIHELAKARLRGVDVRIIIPMEGNHGVMNLNNVIAANTLLKYGVRVFAYPGMSHIKAAIYDGWACVGSANFDKLSFQVNKEMNLGSSDPAFVRQLIDKVFDPDFAAAEELIEPLPASWKNTFATIVASQL